MPDHKYTPYRPEWCEYPVFEGCDYCWGLAVSVDEGNLDTFLADKCRECAFSKHYQPIPSSDEAI